MNKSPKNKKTTVYETQMKTGITRSPEFAKKKLADFAVNVGTKCGHGCTVCSTNALLRMHPSFDEVGQSPFASGYAIVDPTTPARVKLDAARISRRGLVQLCTYSDAWAPEAQAHNLGRKCLEAILGQPEWNVRVLTKNGAVGNDFDLIAQHRSRVIVGLSITAAMGNENVVKVIEPHASPISERVGTLIDAHKAGLRTFAMLCPLLPRIATDPEDIAELVYMANEFGAEEIFAEPVNARGPGLVRTQQALEKAGFVKDAWEIERIRESVNWSAYVVDLLLVLQHALREMGMLDKLRFLLYGNRLTPADRAVIEKNPDGVIWL